MDQSNKQRVVGILVIVVAAVVLLPVLFDGQGSYQMPLESRIPQPVPFPEPLDVAPERPVITADTDQILIEQSSAATTSLPDAVEDVAQDTTSEPEDELASNGASSVEEPAEPVIITVPDDAPVAEAEAPGLDNMGLPQGWSVRLASFSSYANALNLVDRLQSRGHPAYIREMPSAQGVLTAVFVGPGVDRAAVQRLQQQLQEEFELSGIVVRYEIESL